MQVKGYDVIINDIYRKMGVKKIPAADLSAHECCSPKNTMATTADNQIRLSKISNHLKTNTLNSMPVHWNHLG